MSEEEKKAIEYLETYRDTLEALVEVGKYNKQCVDNITKNINIVLNLVKRLDAQIDLEWVENNYIEKSKVISKDKIREKIKELERLNKEQEIPVLKEYKFIRKEMIDYFKELIGEE